MPCEKMDDDPLIQQQHLLVVADKLKAVDFP
jgi:hypothetical protein